ncbi:penicillin-binding protein 2 [Paenibacillus sp. CC-CFT747]|nr:penicillin-binding protein 2 [Paenibacillus sp. CC-CFT747]
MEEFIAKLKEDLKESKGKIRDVGIFLKETEKRYYPNDNLASHVLGYVNREGAAVEGLEKYLDDQLKGTPGKLVREKDRMGVELPDSKVSLDPVVNGKNVRLTIDNKIQYFTENALKKAMDKWKAKSMTAIAVDPKTMEILAMANAPDFNPNKFWEAKSQENFTNHAVASAYEPGSTFKLVTLAGAIQEGLWHPNDKYQSGSIAIPGGAVHDHNRVGWGKISFMEGLLRSSNVAFVKLGYEGLKREGLDSWIAKFGFGKKTGIAMPGEVGGVTGLKYDSDYARATYGQSLTVTALQQTAAYAAIANGGKLMKPQLIKEIINPETKEVEKSFAPEVIRQVVTEETARQTSLALEQVVANQEQGTGRRAYINGYRVAGKTGTANIVKDGERTYSEDTWLISFIGYAPVDDPKILVAVIADQPELGGDYHLGERSPPPYLKKLCLSP